MNDAARNGFDPALAALLDSDRVPPLRADFADRVVGAATVSASLPRTRPAAARWRSMPRRLAIGVIGAGLLASAAAASGLLERIGISLPPVERLWSAAPKEQPAHAPLAGKVPVATASAAAGEALTGPIDSVEKLDRVAAAVAQRRIEVRDTRRAARDARIEARIDEVIARRKAQGLPVPSDAERAALRRQFEQQRAARDAGRDAARARAEGELKQRIEAGETVSPQDVIRAEIDPTGAGQRLRELTPEQRRARLREAIARRLKAGGGAPQPSATPDQGTGQ